MKTSILFTCAALLTIIFQSCSIKGSNISPGLPVASVSAPQDYSYLLKKYVTPSGVRYTEWSSNTADLAKLKNVTSYYTQNRVPSDEKEALAWYLNAYNAWTLQKIFKHWPNEGPLDVSLLFFHRKSIVVSGQRMSFLHLENKIIRKRFNEPRIHFALNCASRSCPPLHNKPFQGNTLDLNLEKLTVQFINQNPYAVVEQNNEVQISKIFKWYKEDFGGESQLLKYINQYRTKKISTDKKVKFLSYNWQLNRAL